MCNAWQWYIEGEGKAAYAAYVIGEILQLIVDLL